MIVKQLPTYTDPNCTQPQTGSGRRRSRVDFRQAALTYFPKTKSQEITKLLDTNIRNVAKSFCNTIHRQVMHPTKITITESEFNDNFK